MISWLSHSLFLLNIILCQFFVFIKRHNAYLTKGRKCDFTGFPLLRWCKIDFPSLFTLWRGPPGDASTHLCISKLGTEPGNPGWTNTLGLMSTDSSGLPHNWWGNFFFFFQITEQMPQNSHILVFINGEGNGTPLQYFCLENPMDGGAW